MTNNLRLMCILFSLAIILLILFLMKKNKVTVKYSLVWLISFSIFLVLSIFPVLLGSVTKLLGFELSSNMVFAILIGILVLINIMLTVIVTTLNKKIKDIVQEISLMKKQK